MVWRTIGNFQNRFYILGSLLNQQITFKNTQPNDPILKVELLGYSDQSFVITAQVQTDAQFQQLAAVLVGFPKPKFPDNDLRILRLDCTDKQLIGHFLHLLSSVQTSLNALLVPIAQLLEIPEFEFQDNYQTPAWFVSGNFQNQFDSGADSLLNRWVSFGNSKTNDPISAIEFLGYRNHSFMITARIPTRAQFQQFKVSLIAGGFSEHDFIDKDLNDIFLFKTNDKNKIMGFLHILNTQQESISHLVGIFTTILGAHANTPHVPSYEERLDAIGYPHTSVPDEIKTCIISTRIMTDPVYDPRCHQYKFERANIIMWINSAGKHPCTRQTLTVDMLVADPVCKKETEEFMVRQEKIYAARKALEENNSATTPADHATQQQPPSQPPQRETPPFG